MTFQVLDFYMKYYINNMGLSGYFLNLPHNSKNRLA